MAQDGAIVPLFGTAKQGYSPVVSAQRRVNLYVDTPADAEKGQIALLPRPGLRRLVSSQGVIVGTFRGMLDGDISGDFGILGDRAAVGVIGDRGTLIFPAPERVEQTYFYPLRTIDGRVRFTRNNDEIVLVDGTTGYVFNPGTLDYYILDEEGTATGFPNGATSITYLAGRIVANKPGTGRFYWSALEDALTWSSLDYATAESAPDDLLAVWASHGELLLFGAYTTEFWAPSTGSAAFARVGGAGAGWGVKAVDSIKNVNEGTIFLGQNFLGEVKVVMMRGYTPQPISTPAIETSIQNDVADKAGGTALAFQANGHSFYVLSFNEKSYCYDLTTGLWSEFSSGTEGGRWVAQYGTTLGNGFIVTDYSVNKVYWLDTDAYADGDETIVREVVTRHVFSDYDRSSVYKLGVDFETGVGLVSGQGSDPQVMLQVSRDNGRTWGNELWRSLGEIGDYAKRVWWTRLGRSRDWLFRLRMSDPVRMVIAGGSLKVGP